MIQEQHREQRVRERAYYIWEDEGRVFGRAEAHWFQAEAELAAATAETELTVAPMAEATVASPSKVLKPAASRAKTKAEKAPAKLADAKVATAKIAATKTAKKAEAPKAALKARRAPRSAESTAALH